MPYTPATRAGRIQTKSRPRCRLASDRGRRTDDAVVFPNLQLQGCRRDSPRQICATWRVETAPRAEPRARRGDVEVLASRNAISVIVDASRLNAAKLTIDQVAEALRATSIVTAAGRLPEDYLQYSVLSTAELAEDVEDGAEVVVAYRERTPVYPWPTSPTCATASSTGPTDAHFGQRHARRRRQRARQSGEHPRRGRRRQGRPEPVPGPRCRPSVRLTVVYDLADFVRNAWPACGRHRHRGVLAVLVLIFFLRDWRVTAIAATSLPLTIVGTFFILYLVGDTINLMSLGASPSPSPCRSTMAIVIAVENIYRHRGAGGTVTVARQKGHAGAAGGRRSARR